MTPDYGVLMSRNPMESNQDTFESCDIVLFGYAPTQILEPD